MSALLDLAGRIPGADWLRRRIAHHLAIVSPSTGMCAGCGHEDCPVSVAAAKRYEVAKAHYDAMRDAEPDDDEEAFRS